MKHFFDSTIDSDFYYFESGLNEFKNMTEFAYGCMYIKHQHDVEVLTRGDNSYQLVTWDDTKIKLAEIPLTMHTFFEKRQFCILDREAHVLDIPEEKFESAVICEDEWDSVFILAKLTDAYVGYWWTTGV